MKKPYSKARHPQINISTLHQICNLIPGTMVKKLALECDVTPFCRKFSDWKYRDQ